MGAEEAAKRKYNQFERNLKEEKFRAEEVRRVKVNYNSKNFETEQKVRDLLRELETEKQQKDRVGMDVDKKTRQLEYENRDISTKVRDDETDLRDKLKELNMMKSENERAQEIIIELEYQNEHEE